MADEKRRTAESRDPEGRDQTGGSPGTTRGRAGTAGTEGANVPRRQRETDEQASERRPGHRRTTRRERSEPGTGATRQHGQIEGTEDGLAGEGTHESGTLPGSVGGTTGASGHSAGSQSPGATDPGFPGMSPDEAEELRRRGRERRSEESD